MHLKLTTDERTCGDCVVNFTNAKTPQVSPQLVVFSMWCFLIYDLWWFCPICGVF